MKAELKLLELAGINDLTGSVFELKNVQAPVKIVDIHLGGRTDILGFVNFFTDKVEYLKRKISICVGVKDKSDLRSSRIGEELEHLGCNIRRQGNMGLAPYRDRNQ